MTWKGDLIKQRDGVWLLFGQNPHSHLCLGSRPVENPSTGPLKDHSGLDAIVFLDTEARLTAMVQLNITMLDDAHPLTEGIRETFSTNVLPFSGSTWAIVAGLFLLFLVHECYAAHRRPLLCRESADHKEGRTLLQIVLLFDWFCMYVNECLLLPLTLDFAESMGQNAAMSGFFGSSSLVASIAGVMMGRVLVSETQWNQRWARAVVIWSPLLGMAATLMEARVSNSHVLGDDSSKRTAFWTMIMLVQVSAFFQSLSYVPITATRQSVK